MNDDWQKMIALMSKKGDSIHTQQIILECDAIIKSVNKEDANSEAFLLRAMAHMCREEYLNAQRDLTRIIQEHALFRGIASWLRGQCYQQLGAFDRAMSDLEAAITLCKEPPAELLNQHKWIEEKAKEQQAQIDDLLVEAARSFEDMDYFQAESSYEKILEKNPFHVDALSRLGQIALLESNQEGSLFFFIKARESCTEEHTALTAEILLFEAFTYYLLKDYSIALDMLKTVYQSVHERSDKEVANLQPRVELLSRLLDREVPSDVQEPDVQEPDEKSRLTVLELFSKLLDFFNQKVPEVSPVFN